jgi:DNA repair protein RadC
MDSPERIFALVGPQMRALSQESVSVLLLDNRHHLIKIEEITRGTLNESLVHPREILRRVIAHSSYCYILVHNHPSGNKQPSHADISITKKMIESGRMLEIAVVEHIIVAGDTYYSFADDSKMQ